MTLSTPCIWPSLTGQKYAHRTCDYVQFRRCTDLIEGACHAVAQMKGLSTMHAMRPAGYRHSLISIAALALLAGLDPTPDPTPTATAVPTATPTPHRPQLPPLFPRPRLRPNGDRHADAFPHTYTDAYANSHARTHAHTDAYANGDPDARSHTRCPCSAGSTVPPVDCQQNGGAGLERRVRCTVVRDRILFGRSARLGAAVAECSGGRRQRIVRGVERHGE